MHWCSIRAASPRHRTPATRCVRWRSRWACTPGRKALDLLRCALILCADHELNTSTFAARVAASTGADLYACLSAAVAAFSGPLHGGASEQVEWLVREAGSPAGAITAVAERMRRGELLPGFGHPLYPGGDPRVPPLLQRAVSLGRARRACARSAR